MLPIPLGQAISFDEEQCQDWCVRLANYSICGDYVDNPTFDLNPVDGWTVASGTQTGVGTFTPAGAGPYTYQFTQTFSMPTGNYKAFYSFTIGGVLATWDGEATITNSDISALALFNNTDNTNSGTFDIVSSGASHTVTLTFSTATPALTLTMNYFYICGEYAYVPETDFCFQVPTTDTGSNLSDTTIDLANLHADDTGPKGANSTGTCGASGTFTWDAGHCGPTVIGADGYYFIKFIIDEMDITWGGYPSTGNGWVYLKYSVDANFELYLIDSGARTEGYKTSVWTMTSGGSVAAEVVSAYYDIGSGTCKIQYDNDGLHTDLVQLFHEDTFTATDDTLYRHKFTLNNATGVTVKVYDSASVLIFQSSSNGVIYDKTFTTGTLPVDKTVTVRYEIDNFLEYESDDFYDDVLTGVTLYEQCSYLAWIETEGEAFIKYLDTEHATSAEVEGYSYNRNIQFCLDVNNVATESGYRIRLIDECDSTRFWTSNLFKVCDPSCEGYKQITWQHGNVKQVGPDDVIDASAYSATSWLWVKADLQDMSFADEREAYVGSNGRYNVPWSLHRETSIMQIWPMSPEFRRTIATALMGEFSINGVAYLKSEEEDYTPQFSARHESAMRVPVTRVDGYTISRNQV